jgi:hypothetical protein
MLVGRPFGGELLMLNVGGQRTPEQGLTLPPGQHRLIEDQRRLQRRRLF